MSHHRHKVTYQDQVSDFPSTFLTLAPDSQEAQANLAEHLQALVQEFEDAGGARGLDRPASRNGVTQSDGTVKQFATVREFAEAHLAYEVLSVDEEEGAA